ncbi:MAG: hypothetical protein WCQ63_00775 [Methanomethylophilus sp.]|nr:hypothetical protein [Methanomethylophilus sp.]MDD4668334.1 hypothetical protein [Methanomethylophilus sp.]
MIEVKSDKKRTAFPIEKNSRLYKVSRRVELECGNISAEHYPLFAAAFFRDAEQD